MARYVDIVALQQPFDPGVVDSNHRPMRIFNVVATKVPSTDPELELATYLQSEGVGTMNSTLFIGAEAVVPSGDGPYLLLTMYGGVAGIRTHNIVQGYAYDRPSFQIVSFAKSPVDAQTLAETAYNKLLSVKNQTLSA